MLSASPCSNMLSFRVNYILFWLFSQAVPAAIPEEFLDLMVENLCMLSDPTQLFILRTFTQGERNVAQPALGLVNNGVTGRVRRVDAGTGPCC
jgi:hypothetical protein